MARRNVYRRDIVEQLRHEDGTPRVIDGMMNFIVHFRYVCDRSADEIIRLRVEIVELKAQLKEAKRGR